MIVKITLEVVVAIVILFAGTPFGNLENAINSSNI